MMFDIQSPLIH